MKNEHAREFYETEALRGGWSVRQLDRQISSSSDHQCWKSYIPVGLGDIVGMVSEGQVSCIREGVGDALFAGFLSSTVTGAFPPSASLLDCLPLESKTALFAAFTASRVEGLREETVLCMANLVADSPNILALGFGTLDVDQVDEIELAGLGAEAAKFIDCLNSEEVIQVLTLPAVVEQ